jgi:hypothetical protein
MRRIRLHCGVHWQIALWKELELSDYPRLIALFGTSRTIGLVEFGDEPVCVHDGGFA